MNLVKEIFRIIHEYFKKHLLKSTVVCASLFIFAWVLSYFIVRALPTETSAGIFQYISENMVSSDVVLESGKLSFIGLFLHNLRAGATMLCCGLVPFLFLPLLLVAFNGGILGTVMGLADGAAGESVFFMFVKYILPHGIFEIPSLVICGAIGIKLCAFLCRKILGKAKGERFRYHWVRCIAIFVVIVVPLVLVAAFIEAVILGAVYL